MITLIIPYYSAPLMLREQLNNIAMYPMGEYKIIVIDDCSPEPADCVLRDSDNVNLYRIDTDIKWNRNGARNLGAHLADTEWMIHIDIDHVLPPRCAFNLLNFKMDNRRWYRFTRWRNGKADDTRLKDNIPKDKEFGKIRPHIDSYLCTKKAYWKAGGYNEDFSGSLGGGSPFLKQLERAAKPDLLPDNIHLYVYTKDKIKDASVNDLSRDKSRYLKLNKKIGREKGSKPLRFEWHKIR